MTQSFEGWYAKNYVHWLKYDENYGEFSHRAYKAGAQSRQTEVDALSALGEMSEQKIDDLVLRNIELRKRIDDAIQEIVDESWIDEYGDNQTPTFKLMNILKGESND